MQYEEVMLKRDCDGIVVPEGSIVHLPAGSRVTITQSLGGSYTVMTSNGRLVRITDRDTDALGKEVKTSVREETHTDSPMTVEYVEHRVWEVLRTCYDPEIPVNIVELGLVYLCQVKPLPDGYAVEIQVTLTAPGCGMGPALVSEMEGKIRGIAGVKEVNVQLVLDPPWNHSMMTEAAKLELGLL